MKILQLYYKVPFPARDGGAIALISGTKCLLAAGFNVKILAMNQSTDDAITIEIPKDFGQLTKFECLNLDNRVTVGGALLAFVRNKDYFSSRFFLKMFDVRLKQLLEQENFDIVQIEHLNLHHYIATVRRYSKAKIVLRSQNIEHLLWKKIACGKSNLLLRIWLGHEAKKLKRLEENISASVNGIIAISHEDANYFRQIGNKIPVAAISVGIDFKLPNSEGKQTDSRTTNFYHLGSMDWQPNQEGAKWFFNTVVPLMNSKGNCSRFHFAGKKMPAELMKWNDEKVYFIQGQIESVDEFLADKDILIVPVLSGGGVRIKILEALANGKSVISTTEGAKGLPLEVRNLIQIAQDQFEMARMIEESIGSVNAYRERAINYSNVIQRHCGFSELGSKFKSFYSGLLSNDN